MPKASKGSKASKASKSKTVRLKDLKVCHPMPNMEGSRRKKSSAKKKAGFVSHDGEEAVVETSKKWPTGKRLKVYFMPGHDKKVAAKCLAIMKEWEEHANLTFEETSSAKDSDIRVAFEKGGSYSYIGTDAKHIGVDKHTMNFGWLTEKSPEEEYQRVVLHETGHAIGLLHEHEHPENTIPWNEEAVLAYYRQQGWTAAQTREQVLTKASSQKTQYTKWDKNSIMEYPIPKELVTDDTYSVGWNTKLSASDKAFIREQYPGAKGKKSKGAAPSGSASSSSGKKSKRRGKDDSSSSGSSGGSDSYSGGDDDASGSDSDSDGSGGSDSS